MNFQQWMEAIDQAVLGTAFCSVHDLSDQPFRDWFDSGIDAEEAARMALKDNDFDTKEFLKVKQEVKQVEIEFVCKKCKSTKLKKGLL